MGSTLEVKKFLLLGQNLSLKAILEFLPMEANAKSQKLFPIVKMALKQFLNIHQEFVSLRKVSGVCQF